MAQKKIQGKYQILFLAEEGEAYLPVGCLTSNDLNKSIDIQDGIVTKCETDPEPEYGKRTYEVPFEAVAIEDNVAHASYTKVSEMMDNAYEANKPLYWKIETTLSNNTKVTEYGKGILASLERSAPADGVVTFSGSISGSGKVSDVDLNDDGV